MQADLFQNQPAAMRPMPEGRAKPLSPESARPARNASTGQPDNRGMRSTSRDAMAEHRETGKLGAQQQQVFAALTKSGQAFTRAELAQRTGIRLSAICGRSRELLDLQLIKEGPRRQCSVTGKNAHVLEAA